MLTPKFYRKHLFLFDLDGVIWKGNKPVQGAIETLVYLEEKSHILGFVTNNSSISRKGFIEKLTTLGFTPASHSIFNSAYGAARYLAEHKYKRIFVIGEEGLKQELDLQKIYSTDVYEPNLQAVCIGWDRQLTWKKLADAMRVIVNDKGFFIGTNPDNSYPLEDRLVPGAGAGIAALSNACGKEPDIIIGKPNRYMIDLALNELGCTKLEEAVFVGDRLSTDILAGINAGIDTILVSTGISDNHLKKTILPTLKIDSIADICKLL